ncbi:unnamed protein product [Bursaphelenchus xylophilus]|uniref:(pine wood nematode) hypothetical protein n=1 Tax=Bursaphelenchus xylophilus TaxID=6326 RepID=A0A1I7RL62_BURXY|nr:unnamed protein product [Bursaphelenchus xylophilus]CAG9083408.1 unnamed protein product [Bursaphelenchus xylophilus]
MENQCLKWYALNGTDRESYLHLVGLISFTIGIVEAVVFLLLALLLPIGCLIFDIITSKRHVPRAPIMIDPKGFTINDLIMLNVKQKKSPTTTQVRECGSTNVLSSSAVLLPPTPTKPMKRLIDLQFEAAKVKETEDPVNVLYIEEYKDNSYLASNTEVELTTNMEQVRESTEKESNSAMGNNTPA